MNAAEVDRMLAEPAVVFGSLPPHGRDLDLLVSPAERQRLASELAAAGWLARGRSFARFRDGKAFAVDLVVVSDWAPTPWAAVSLREQAEALPGHQHLLRPTGHHRLLILARRLAEGAPFDDRRRAQLADFSADDWTAALAEAPAWNLEGAVLALRRGVPPPVVRQRRAVRAYVRKLAGARRRRGSVVALSGVDGCGKSTHAERLRDSLQAVSVDAVVEWTKIARDPLLGRVARPVKALIAVLPRRPSATVAVGDVDESAEVRNYPDGPPPPADPGKSVRRSSAVLTWGWTLVVAYANAMTHRATVRRHVRAGRVVICDRYVLDSLAHLRYRYGSSRRFPLQSLIIRALSPRPALAVFLDVSPATARARKPEQYTTRDLGVLRSLYQQEAARMSVRTVDAEQPVDAVADELAAAAWRALRDGDRRPRRRRG